MHRVLVHVVLPLLVGVAAGVGGAALVGSDLVALAALTLGVVFLGWETIGPGGRRRRELQRRLEMFNEMLSGGERRRRRR